jgi:hypothetical protein
MSEHSGVGKIPQARPVRASFLRQEAPNQNTAGGKVRDVINVMKQIIEKVLFSAPLAVIAIGLAAPASAAPNPSVTLGCNCRQTAPADSPALREEIKQGIREGLTVTPAPPASAAVAPGGTGVHIALTGCIGGLNCG